MPIFRVLGEMTYVSNDNYEKLMYDPTDKSSIIYTTIAQILDIFDIPKEKINNIMYIIKAIYVYSTYAIYGFLALSIVIGAFKIFLVDILRRQNLFIVLYIVCFFLLIYFQYEYKKGSYLL